ncbi:hypothetical protein [uncultured Arcticibacterium sp.]|uniref:hypothetical protein n=1 Tax=uncultured Arcticibacterium sp. TaxID=2173042 RepID=UPI0030F730BC
MSTTELKNLVLEKVQGIDKEYLLEDLLHLIEFDSETISVPEEHKKGLGQGLEDITKGNVILGDKVEADFEKWLNE